MYYEIGKAQNKVCPLFEGPCSEECAWWLRANATDYEGACTMSVSGHGLWIMARDIKSRLRRNHNG